MGWLELLPLLKRLLPLLTRVAPMLEGVAIGRSGGGKEAEAALERVSDEMKSAATVAAESHGALLRTLSGNAEQLVALNDAVEQLRLSSTTQNSRFISLEMQGLALARSMKTFAAVVIGLLVVCAGLLLTILLRH